MLAVACILLAAFSQYSKTEDHKDLKTLQFSWKKEHLKLWTSREWLLEGLKLPKKAVVVHWGRRKDALRQFQESGRRCLLGPKNVQL